jgi:hypothetical protein
VVTPRSRSMHSCLCTCLAIARGSRLRAVALAVAGQGGRLTAPSCRADRSRRLVRRPRHRHASPNHPYGTRSIRVAPKCLLGAMRVPVGVRLAIRPVSGCGSAAARLRQRLRHRPWKDGACLSRNARVPA